MSPPRRGGEGVGLGGKAASSIWNLLLWHAPKLKGSVIVFSILWCLLFKRGVTIVLTFILEKKS